MEHTLNRKAAFQGGCDLGGLKKLLFLSDYFSSCQDKTMVYSLASRVCKDICLKKTNKKNTNLHTPDWSSAACRRCQHTCPMTSLQKAWKEKGALLDPPLQPCRLELMFESSHVKVLFSECQCWVGNVSLASLILPGGFILNLKKKPISVGQSRGNIPQTCDRHWKVHQTHENAAFVYISNPLPPLNLPPVRAEGCGRELFCVP